jgi:hypothetical protein
MNLSVCSLAIAELVSLVIMEVEIQTPHDKVLAIQPITNACGLSIVM